MDLKRERKLTLIQKETLVSFMARNKDFAKNKLTGINAKMQTQLLWKELTDKLNKQGPFKTIPKWQRVWTDLKIKARRKAAGIPYGKNKQAPVVFKYCEEEIVALLAKEDGFTQVNIDEPPDPLVPVPESVKTEVDSWTDNEESEISWQEINNTELKVHSRNNYLKEESSYNEHSTEWLQPESEEQHYQENIPSTEQASGTNETAQEVKLELPAEENICDDKDNDLSQNTAAELNALTYQTNRNILEVKQEISSLNCKVDKFLEQNIVTNALLSRIAVALEQIAEK